MKSLGVYVILFCSSMLCYGQTISLDDKSIDKFSYKPVHESRIMYKKMMWRMIDLREKQNQPLFAQGSEVTQVLIDAVKAGLVQPWKTDSLSDGSPMTSEEFLEKLIIPSNEEVYSDEELEFLGGDGGGDDDPFGFGGDDPFGFGGDDPFGMESEEKTEEEKAPKQSQVFYYEGKDLWQLEVKENLIFDKQRSIMIHDIQALTIVIPADHPDNVKGIEETVASFSYKELMEKVFTNNPKAIWYNPHNDKEHKSLADAFELRLFSSYLTKINNPTNETITDKYGGSPDKGIQASHLEEEKILEFEHNLWSY